MLGTVRKRDRDLLDYDVTFERWMYEDDAITDASASASGVTVERIVIESPIVKVWISGGLAGNTVPVVVTATTAKGRIKEVSFHLRITEC